MKSAFVQPWFLIGLVAVLAVGIVFARPLQPISEWNWLRDATVAAVMLCMSLPLEARAMWQSMRRLGPPLLAIAITFGFVPLVAWVTAPFLRGDLGPGLLVAAATPCTLASASVWTRRAGGNDAVSTLVTVATNALCFVVTPLLLFLTTGAVAASPELGLTSMTLKLVLLVVAPILIAQGLRRWNRVAAWCTHHKMAFGVASQCGILFMIFLGAIHTGLKLAEQSYAITVFDFAAMTAAVLGIHVLAFWAGMVIGKSFGFSREDQIAVGFSGSQKTLMVGLLMAITLKVSILPMVAYHCLQLFVDTLIADSLRKKGEQEVSAG